MIRDAKINCRFIAMSQSWLTKKKKKKIVITIKNEIVIKIQ